MKPMTKEELEFEITECVTSYEGLDHPEVYASISREAVKAFFEEAGVTPLNIDDEPDDSYVEGEVQFIFNMDGDGLNEILIFPVYEDEDGFTNGSEFVSAPDWMWAYEEDAKKELEECEGGINSR